MRRIKIVHRVFSSICGITLPSPRIRVDFGICRVQAKRRVVLRNASRTQSNFKFDRTPSLSLTSVARIFYFEYTFIWVLVCLLWSNPTLDDSVPRVCGTDLLNSFRFYHLHLLQHISCHRTYSHAHFRLFTFIS